MPEYLVVRLAEDSSDATWIALDDAGHRLTQPARGSLQDAAADAANRRVLLLVPGPSVVLTQASVPAKNRARIQQMLPYALEETVAEDVDKLLFAAGTRTESGAVSVAVVARQLMDEWRARCEQAGLNPYAFYSETDGVPNTPGSLTLLLEGERAYGRLNAEPPFALEGLSLAQILELPQADGARAGALRHVVIYADATGLARCKAELPRLRERLGSIDVQVLSEGPLARLGATLVSQPGTNLLQGPYAPKSNWGALVRPWRVAAALLLGFCVLLMATEGARYFSLSRQDQALTSLLEANCQRSFQAPALAACRSEIQRRLAAVGAQSDTGAESSFLGALAAVADARGAGSEIEALNYRNGVMDLRVMAPSVPALDEFARNMGAGDRFQVNIQSANPSAEGVEGRLQIVGAP